MGFMSLLPIESTRIGTRDFDTRRSRRRQAAVKLPTLAHFGDEAIK
jgi:hypothetical protein